MRNFVIWRAVLLLVGQIAASSATATPPSSASEDVCSEESSLSDEMTTENTGNSGIGTHDDANDDDYDDLSYENEKEYETAAQDLIQYIQSFPTGYVNEKLEIRKRTNSTSNSFILGLFSSVDDDDNVIQEGELLLNLPFDSLFRSSLSLIDDESTSTSSYDDRFCDLKNQFLHELHLGSESKYAPYINYVKTAYNMNDAQRIPSSWSQKGRDLLEDMLSETATTTTENASPANTTIAIAAAAALPPDQATDFLDIDCFDRQDEDNVFAMASVMSLVWDEWFVMTPLYDFTLLRRARGGGSNTVIEIQKEKGSIEIRASTIIGKRQELILSAFEDYGTPGVFRDYGFIEDYPQLFHFYGYDGIAELSIAVFKDENGNLDAEFVNDDFPIPGALLGGEPQMKSSLEKLKSFKVDKLVPANKSDGTLLPETELKQLMDYNDALTTALTLGLSKVSEAYYEKSTFYPSTHTLAGSSSSSPDYIYNLPEETSTIQSIETVRKMLYQSETLVYDTVYEALIDQYRSTYQLIDMWQDPNSKDTCLHLDTVFQICGSYWPYYHEMQVHKPAKYIKEDIKRVLFVGAGDSGLLNEIIKYPNLELVVGLELDQHVTRMAFKHFGARPHYDDERVQWWYGDASKTLLMLPKEYFGSFDMVLVDLSDTIFALSVSGELDVIGALSLLLRPGGIFAMNELFFRRVSDTFQYSIWFLFHGVPKLDDQAFVFASHDVDFLKQDLTDHHIANLLVEDSLLATTHPFEFVHDYRRNPNPKSSEICKNTTVEENEDSLSQDTSPGIFMVLEVEQIHWKHLGSITHVQNAVKKALKKRGFNLLSGKDKVLSSDSSFVLVLKEGYVSVHVFPEGKFCAFDILLWSSFDKFEDVKRSLIKAVGGRIESTSSYRIVTGGMFGVSTWKEDRKSHGPQLIELCSDTDDDLTSKEVTSPSPEDVYSIALLGSLDLVHDADVYYVAVLCGEKSESCVSFDVLENKNKNITIVPVYACTGDKASPESSGCTLASAKETLMESVESKIRVVVIDKSAPKNMGEVILMMHENDMLEENLLAIAMIDSRRDLWRRQAIDRVRRRIRRMDPVFRAHVLFNTTKEGDIESTRSSMELALVSSGDVHFFDHLNNVVSEIENKSEYYTLEIRNIFGGLWKSMPKYIFPDNEALPTFQRKDDGVDASLNQWRKQKPVSIQSISQYKILETLQVGDKVKLLTDEQEDDEEFTIVMAIINKGLYTIQDDAGEEKDVFRVDLDQTRQKTRSFMSHEEVEKTVTKFFSLAKNDDADVNIYNDVGDGSVTVAIWDTTTVVIVWDGNSQVDVNIQTTKGEKLLKKLLNVFEKAWRKHVVIKLQDIQPRGHGRVVNFEEPKMKLPHWA